MQYIFLETSWRREETKEERKRESSERKIETGGKITDRETETGQTQGHAAVGEYEGTR